MWGKLFLFHPFVAANGIDLGKALDAAIPAVEQAQTTPIRDPLTPGYVRATELRDGAVPVPDVDGNFIIGPTHTPSPDVSIALNLVVSKGANRV